MLQLSPSVTIESDIPRQDTQSYRSCMQPCADQDLHKHSRRANKQAVNVSQGRSTRDSWYCHHIPDSKFLPVSKCLPSHARQQVPARRQVLANTFQTASSCQTAGSCQCLQNGRVPGHPAATPLSAEAIAIGSAPIGTQSATAIFPKMTKSRMPA